MPNKIVALITGILFFITTQTTSAQSNEKWLPESISMYIEGKKDFVNYYFEYNDLNQLTTFTIATNQNRNLDIIENRKKFEYGSDNNIIKAIEYLSMNDSIVAESELQFNTLDNNKIEIKRGSNNTVNLHLDKDHIFLIKLEETTSNNIKRRHETTTFEYRNNFLYKQTVSTLFETYAQGIEDERKRTLMESRTESTSHTYEIKTDKFFPFYDFYPRWLLTYFRIDDLIVFPSAKIDSSDPDKDMKPEMDVTYHYNNENYLTGWTVIDPNEDEKIHCEIEYIKAK